MIGIGNFRFVVLFDNEIPKLCVVRCRKISRLNFTRGTIRAQASNVGVGPGDYEANKGNGSQNVFGDNQVDDNDNSSKM